jgi:RNA polymerase sigma factor (sigma-70 family)
MSFQAVANLKPLPGPSNTRATLVARLHEWSDDESWQDFFDLYWKLIYGAAVHAGLTEREAEEVVQATMIAISKNIRTFKYDPNVGSFRGWVCKQAWWKIQDQFRARQAQHKHLVPPKQNTLGTRTATVERVPDPRNELARLEAGEWMGQVARVAMERVRTTANPKQFQMYDLHVTKRWPIREVARLLNVNPAQVYLAKSRISRQLTRTAKQVVAELERQPPVGKGET